MRWRVASVLLLVAPVFMAPVLAADQALAQGAPAPAAPVQGAAVQEGNIYNGRDHQPVAGATNQAEQAAGVNTPGAQQQQIGAVESLNNQVQQGAATPTGQAAGCTANKTKCSR